jgi:bifunctional UDP-N-acetylglucosamine pyrophosphorylase/glucosamine-1-phosphate N-acetyltransferase
MKTKAIILAAGKGSRMKSDTLKVLHNVAGKPILQYVVDAVSKCGVDEIFVVIGHQAEKVKSQVKGKNLTFITQTEQLGTGHAVMQVEPYIGTKEHSTIIVLAGDCPLINPETISSLLERHRESNASVSILSTKMKDPATYGRILRGRMGTVVGIKEAKDCTKEELEINEINTGIYAFHQEALCDSLKLITTNNAQQEYYLTDVIHIIKSKGDVVEALCIPDSDQAVGINTRMDLAKINEIIYQNTNINLMKNGVTIVDPKTTYIDGTVEIGQDTIIEPSVVIKGSTTIGKNVTIQSFSYIENAIILDDTIVSANTVKVLETI